MKFVFCLENQQNRSMVLMHKKEISAVNWSENKSQITSSWERGHSIKKVLFGKTTKDKYTWPSRACYPVKQRKKISSYRPSTR